MTGIVRDLFGPGTWGTGGNMVAWVICGFIGFGWLHAKQKAQHVQVLAQAARHHKELMAQAATHHQELKAHVTAHCADVCEHVSAVAEDGPVVPPPATTGRRRSRM
jgi:hypothetical protein